MSRSSRSWFVVVLALAPAIAGAADAKPTIPKQIGGIPYKTGKKFDDPALGVALTYKDDTSALNIFIYNGNVGDIPNGIDSDLARAQFKEAQSDVLASKAWTDVRFVSEGTVQLGTKADLKSYLALFEASEGERQYYSILYLTTGRNRFYKARLTTPKGSALLEPEPMAQLRRDLGDFIESLLRR